MTIIGYRQGLMLEPILFILFINDIIYFFTIFADDTSVAVSARNNEELIIKLYVLLGDFEKWFSLNKFS